MENNQEFYQSLPELSHQELLVINGGKISLESSLAYDISFFCFRAIHFIGAAIENAIENPIRPSEYR